MAGYIGSKAAVVSSGAERKKVFTATSGQTSFTGLSYTVNNVHVFQNGVRLVDGTDYTATDGTSLTLTVGASVNDQIVVVSYSTFQTSDTVSASAGGTFAGDVNFTGAFTSQGIDDNATSTAMTLDGSGNLLVGTTDTTLYTNTSGGETGFSTSPAGFVQVARDGGVAAAFNRLSSDGDIMQFRKDGTTVGSIGTTSSDLYIGTGDTTLRFADGVDGVIPTGTNGAQRDGAVNLGAASNRFQHLYLSGGVFLGGTGAANKLDDYEEGTWTPTVIISSGTYSVSISTYIKIGNMVTVDFLIGFASAAGASLQVNNLPFTSTTRSIGIGREDASSGYGVFGRITVSGVGVDIWDTQGTGNQIGRAHV